MSSSLILTTKGLLNGYLSLALRPAPGTTIPGPGNVYAYGGNSVDTLFDTTDGELHLASGFENVTAQFDVAASGNAQGTVVLDQAINTDVILLSGPNYVVAVPAGQLEGKFTIPVTGGAKIPIRDATKHVQQLLHSAPQQQQHSAESRA